ncbi:Uncharacterised protein [Mycobacteroides abscessus]|nr:Uncharacterised protein [Mycobacteroides abscessus]
MTTTRPPASSNASSSRAASASIAGSTYPDPATRIAPTRCARMRRICVTSALGSRSVWLICTLQPCSVATRTTPLAISEK